MESQFIHLNLHTEFSLIDSTVQIDALVKTCVAQHIPTIALTDRMNLFGLVKFYQGTMSKGVKPIIGLDILLENSDDINKPHRAILLCKDNIGYQNLINLVSRAYTDNQINGQAQLKPEWLIAASKGLIMLSGAHQGDVGQALLAQNSAKAEEQARHWQALFPDSYYLELQRVGHPDEEAYIDQAVKLAQTLHLPVVATNPVRFLEPDDFAAHEVRVAIHDGYTLTDPKRPKHYTPQYYLRSPADMQQLFADIPSAIQNTLEIAKRCNVSIQLGKTSLPNYEVPEGMSLADYFQQAAQTGLEERLAFIDPSALSASREAYQARLDTELDVIVKMGFTGYFLIVADFIQWAKQNDIPVGPGRGSGAGSLVAYVLKITDLDPIEHTLLFERFLNPERVSMPDFDIDFCMEGRDRVIDYVANRYGKEAVSQIITYGTMAAKAVVRDVGRVLGHPYGFVDKLAKLIPFELGITLSKALEQEEQLAARYQAEDEVKELFNLAMRLEGITRNVGKHAGGVVIAPSKLTDFIPLYTESMGAGLVSQFDKDDVEAIGLVKFDFLGLRTLTIIDWAVKAINEHRKSNGESTLDIARIDMKDKKSFDLLQACNTTAVFQLESRGMKDLIKRLQPDSFADIVALVALFRPGPLQSGMVDDFINRKHGRSKVEYPHPDLEDILKETYGIILYQEQVMQIAQVLAGYSLGSADILRRAMGKKKPEEMAKQRAIFVSGSQERGVDPDVANGIFDLMEKFAGYGFNKSHSAAYALLSYQTAWLKAHYPAQFLAAVLSSDMDNTDKVVIFYEDAKAQGLTILPPDVNESLYRFKAMTNDTIRYGLGAIKGVGEAAVTLMVQSRELDGHYQDMFEFCTRLDSRKVNRRVLEALIKSGAFDGFGHERGILMASLDQAMHAAEQRMHNDGIGQADLFGGSSATSHKPDYATGPIWSEAERLDAEKESLGLFLSGHPLLRYEAELSKLTNCSLKDFTNKRQGVLRVAGMICALKTVMTRKGERMAILTLDDRNERVEVAIFPSLYQSSRSLIEKDALIIVEGEVQQDRFTGDYKFNANKIYSLLQARQAFSRGILLHLQATADLMAVLPLLQSALSPYKGGNTDIFIEYYHQDVKGRLQLGQEWRVYPSDELVQSVGKIIGEQNVEMLYTA